MPNSLEKYFNSKEFKEILKTFEDILKTKKEVYLDVDDCTALCEYYASAGIVDKAYYASLYGLYLHPGDLDLQLYQCDNAIADGDFYEAQNVLNRIPDKTDEQVRLAQCEVYLMRGRIKEARALFDLMVSESEDPHTCMSNIADLLNEYDHFDEAYSWLERALREDPECVVALSSLADCYFQDGRTKEAKTVIEKLLDMNPYEEQYWNCLAQCNLMEDNPEKAIEAADFALAIDPECVTAMNLKGSAYTMLMDLETAIEWFEKSHSLVTYCRKVLEQLILLYYAQGHYEQCAECCKEMLERCPELRQAEKSQLYAKRGDSLTRAGKYEEAIEALNTAIKIEWHKYAFYAYRANALLHMGRKKEGVSELVNAWCYALDEDKEEAVKMISMICIENGLYDDALFYLEHLISWHCNIITNGAWMYIALCYMMTGDNAGMESFINKTQLHDRILDEETRQAMENIHEGLFEAFRTAQQRVAASGKP